MNGGGNFILTRRGERSMITTGWVCIVLGFLTFWMCGLGAIFFAVSFVLGILLLFRNRIAQGIAMLAAAVVGPVICIVVMFMLGLGMAGAILHRTTDSGYHHPHVVEPVR